MILYQSSYGLNALHWYIHIHIYAFMDDTENWTVSFSAIQALNEELNIYTWNVFYLSLLFMRLLFSFNEI